MERLDSPNVHKNDLNSFLSIEFDPFCGATTLHDLEQHPRLNSGSVLRTIPTIPPNVKCITARPCHELVEVCWEPENADSVVVEGFPTKGALPPCHIQDHGFKLVLDRGVETGRTSAGLGDLLW